MQIDKPIATAAILFIIVLLIFFLVVPEYREFRHLQQAVGEKQAQFDAQYAYFSEIAKTYHDLEDRRDILKKVDDALPDASSLGRMMYFFHQKAAENGLMVNNVFLSGQSEFSKGKTKGNIKEITFSIDVAGSYYALKSFIDSMEKSARLFEVAAVSFSAPISLSSAVLQESGQTGRADNQQNPMQAQLQSQQTYNFKMEVKAHSY